MHNSKGYFNKGIIKNWSSGMVTQTQLSQIRFYAKISHVKTFHNILRAISFSDSAVFQIGDHGMKVIVEEARTVQASAYFKKTDNSFTEYRYKAQNNESVTSFSINLKVIVENLNMFSEDQSQLKMLYKGDGAPLVLIIESEDEDLTTECSIKTRELQSLLDLEINEDNNLVLITFRGFDFFNFLNDLFKAVPAADDMELAVSNQVFTTIMRGSVDAVAEYNLDKGSDIVMFFRCSKEVKVQYKSSHMKLLLKTLQIAKTTTLSVDKDGMLGVRVMIEDENKFQSYVEYFVMPLNETEP